jgi:hypothetical protein
MFKMEKNYKAISKSITHLKILHQTFLKKNNFTDKKDFQLYKKASVNLSKLLDLPEVQIHKQLYNEKSRQMILADILEYIFLSRGIFFMSEKAGTDEKKKQKRSLLIQIILEFVNLLMIYESMTVDSKLRKNALSNLSKKIPEIKDEDKFSELLSYSGMVGLPEKDLEKEPKKSYFNKYFDKLLPKRAGGLWHELLVFIFLLRENLGYIIPLLLNQKFFSAINNIVPPDFLILANNSKIYGVEVGIKKEIQSGTFSLQTNIPTATIDTINSRCSDRCPKCKRWILFCPQIIKDYSNMDKKIEKVEIKCLDTCTIYKKDDILNGKCPYSKYSRNKNKTINHKYCDGLHYHYACVLEGLSKSDKKKLIKQKDKTAIKTHYPYYSGLEPLFEK